MEIGDFTNAAVLYEKLARQAHDQGRPRQAGHLYVQAARASLLSGQEKTGLDLLEQGLYTFAQANLWGATMRVGNRAVEELRQLGHAQAAEDLSHKLESMQAKHPATVPPGGPEEPRRVSLPLKCPSCGATVRPDEVEWIGDARAVCDYCGSLLAS
jgi:hypothetical protein